MLEVAYATGHPGKTRPDAHYFTPKQIDELASATGLTAKQVQGWMHRRRRKDRRCPRRARFASLATSYCQPALPRRSPSPTPVISSAGEASGRETEIWHLSDLSDTSDISELLVSNSLNETYVFDDIASGVSQEWWQPEHRIDTYEIFEDYGKQHL